MAVNATNPSNIHVEELNATLDEELPEIEKNLVQYSNNDEIILKETNDKTPAGMKLLLKYFQ